MSEQTSEPRKGEEPEVKVSDRRRFSAAGEPREPDPADSGESSHPIAAQETADTATVEQAHHPSPAEESASPPAGQHPTSLPPASFELLVISLGMQVEIELGSHAETTGSPPNLDIARHSIDMLAMLQKKTAGNLTLDEKRLLENTLTELRFRYVQAVGQINQQAKSG